MIDSGLRAVVSLDTETQSYKPVAHNLTSQQAIDHLEKLLADKITGAIVVQDKHHRAVGVLKCKQCKRVAEDFAERLSQPTPGDDSERAESMDSLA